eukprot:g33196.t1
MLSGVLNDAILQSSEEVTVEFVDLSICFDTGRVRVVTSDDQIPEVSEIKRFVKALAKGAEGCPTVFLRHVSSTKVKPLSPPGGQLNPFPIPPPCSGKFPFTPLSSTLGNGLELLETSYVTGVGNQGLSM